MDVRTLQQQILIGSSVTFFLKTGPILSGVLTELSRNHVVIETKDKRMVIALEMIGACQIEESGEEQADDLETSNGLADSGFAESALTETAVASQAIIPHQDNNHGDGRLDSPVLSSPNPAIPPAATLATLRPVNGDSTRPPAATGTAPVPPDPEITISLLAIEATYDARILFARLDLDNIDFQFPAKEIEESHHHEVRTAWQNIKSIYDYAVRVNELDPRYGRTGRFAHQLARLAEQYPETHSLKRQAAQAARLAEQPKNALELWKKVAIATQGPGDWKNLAAIAFQAQDEGTCCYALGQYYAKVPLSEGEGAWFIFINLLRKFSNYAALLSILQSRATLEPEESRCLFEAGVYLTKLNGRSDLAERYMVRAKESSPSRELLADLYRHLPQEPVKGYEQLVTEFDALMRPRDPGWSNRPRDYDTREGQASGRYVSGYIKHYKSDKSYGFIAGKGGADYFFHVNSVSDPGLVQMLKDEPQTRPQVRFLAAKGDRGMFAYSIEVLRSVEDMAKLAHHYADLTEYQKAAAEMRHVLNLQPDYPDGRTLQAQWHHFATEKKLREAALPKGTSYYARAKCADIIEDNHDRAVELYKLAIQNNDRVESAVKDLAMVLDELGRNQEAIDLLNDYRDQAKDPRSIDGLLMTFYQKTGETEKAIPLLYKRAERAPNAMKRAQILLNIANLHLGKQEYEEAERVFRQVLAAQPGHTIAKRHIAICLLKQNQLDEAERVLNELLEHASDAQAAAVLNAVQQARTSGMPTDVDILINTSLSDFFTEISTFTKFFLDHCDYKGVPPDRIQAQKFNWADVERLEERAALLGSRLPRDRSSFYLSAAKINSAIEDSDPNRFYRYLCRSFASMGDAIMIESGMLDSACDLYGEALAVYDNDHSRSKDEQDAVNALIRVLYATLGAERIPMLATGTHLSIDEAIESVIVQHPNRTRVFHYIAYLIYRSRYAAARILTRLFRSRWSTAALEYLRDQSVEVPKSVKNADEFGRLWDELRRRRFDDYQLITNEFRYLARIEIVPSALEDCASRTRFIDDLLFFELDRRRSREFQRILDSTLELCRQTAFEDRERLCLQADSRCRELMREIETSPTKFSIEQLHPVLQSLQQKLSIWLEELYQRSTPSLSLRLAFESYSPDSDRQIEVQIAIENQPGRSPAEDVEIMVVQDSDQFFSLPKPDLRLKGSLRGGDQEIVLIPLQLTPLALSAEAFSMTVYVQYRTRSEQEPAVVVENFSIQLTTEFEDFDNPYQAYAKGGVVRESSMFYGRREIIGSVVHTLMTNPTSKSLILYGQKRSGKSSILYHLKEALNENADMLVLDIENIGVLLDEKSPTPLLYQILWAILRRLQRSIRRREEQGYSELGLTFSTDLELYTHPAPLQYFNDFFADFEDHAARLPDWKNVRLVLLIDEFSYIYGYIVRGTLSEDFMVNWKALLQGNHFSAVLAGQDVMPKFIKRFSNQWGTTEDRQIGYLSDEDAWALIDEPILIGGKSGESRFREKAIERIIELTAGNPFYIQIICSRLVEHMRIKRQKLATKADVERIRDNLIRGVAALKLSDFDNLISSGDTSPDAVSDNDALQVLKVVARNTQQVSTCGRGEIVCEADQPIDVILEDLVHRNVLECERGSYYRIRVGLFKEWLIANS